MLYLNQVKTTAKYTYFKNKNKIMKKERLKCLKFHVKNAVVKE